MTRFIVIFLTLIAVWYIKTNWQYWTQDVQDWKIRCTFPETQGHIQTVGDYRVCLSSRRITPNDADIRRMCYYYARDEYYIQTNQYPTDSDPKENSLYQACLHEQGLPN